MKKLIVLLAVVTACLSSGFVLAGDHDHGKDPGSSEPGKKNMMVKKHFAKFDLDKDNSVSHGEWTGRFEKLDSDKDQSLTLEEFRDGDDCKMAEKEFKKFDHDGDGKISVDEWTHHFHAMDANEDHAVSFEEFEKAHKSEEGCKMLKKKFEALDTDKDGTISKEEWLANFDKTDADADGAISFEELKAAHDALMDKE